MGSDNQELMCRNTETSMEKSVCRNSRIMLFELVSTGHHAAYIRHLIKHWGDNHFSGELLIVVNPKFTQEHQDVVNLANGYQNALIKFISISDYEFSVLEENKTAFKRAFRYLGEWHLLCKYAASLRADHCLIMYLDTCELPLMLGLKPPCLFSGIYFRPTFHYKTFDSYRLSRKNRLQHVRERIFVHQILKNPKLHTLFCLDPLVDISIKKLYPAARAIPLADPVEIPNVDCSESNLLRERHNISLGRKIFLLFGSIDSRKGVYKLLKSLEQLSPELCQQTCLLIVGRASASDQSVLNNQIEELCLTRPIQIITHFEFVTDLEVQSYFYLADVVLALYQKHVGMSGILLLAAAAKKPVLSTNYGLMGELVRLYQLGLAVDSTCPQKILGGLTQFLESNELPCDLDEMSLLVEKNLATKFSSTIFENISFQNV